MLFKFLCFGAAGLGAIVLVLLLGKLVLDGLPKLSLEFVKGSLSSRARRTGIWPALMGTAWIMALTGLIAVPIGVAAAVYLEEFTTRKTKVTEFIQLNISNLAGVPSIVYGLLGLAVFVRWTNLGYSVLAGALTMSLLVLPMIIIVTQEAIRAVPKSYRDGSLALGSTQWQSIRYQVLPSATPGILTGVILAISRAIGETAPLIVVGAVAGVVSSPVSPKDRYTVLPMQIFNWAGDARADFHAVAASAILVLMVALLALNSIAIYLRNRTKRA